ncbi:MAG TPA: hypothetical protein VM266_01675 [Solirubrobacteraceae bacterium]|nr:hypothetical protein [Solirubrobacteraceae bacterium]
MSLATHFISACLIAAVAIGLGIAVDDAFAALLSVSGLLLATMAVRGLTSDRDWRRFTTAPSGATRHLRGQGARLIFCAITFVIGTGWIVAGVVGLLTALGAGALPPE